MSTMSRRKKPLGTRSSHEALATFDGRSRQSRLLRETVRELTAHVGGSPTVTQQLIIDRVAQIRLQLMLHDEKIAAGEATDYDGKVYGALHNHYRLLLRELGIKGAATPAPDPGAALAAHLVAVKARQTPAESAS